MCRWVHSTLIPSERTSEHPIRRSGATLVCVEAARDKARRRWERDRRTRRGARRRNNLKQSKLHLQFQHDVQRLNLVKEKVGTPLDSPWDSLQEFLLELHEGFLNRLDLRLIHESITISAHSWLFLGPSKTFFLNPSQSFSSNFSSPDSSINTHKLRPAI